MHEKLTAKHKCELYDDDFEESKDNGKDSIET